MSNGKYRKEQNCLNCGFHVEKHYCSSCGQPNLDLKENLWDFISHSVAHYFHFDNKFFQTLKPLLRQPGKVTLDYLAGKRARYINPVSMYIFVSIVYFIVVATPKKKEKSNSADLKTELQQEYKTARADEKNAIEALIYRETFRGMSFQKQAITLDSLKENYQANKNDSLYKMIKKLEAIHVVRNDSTYESYLSRQKKLAEQERDNFFERFMQKREIDIGKRSEALQEQLEHNRSKQYFLFMPLMALFIMINFRKNHIRYLDHLIFTIHGMTAFFIVSIIVQPIKRFLLGGNEILTSIVELALIAWVFWYLFKSLQIFYQRKNSTTIGRMIWIVILYGITLKISETIILNIIFYLNG